MSAVKDPLTPLGWRYVLWRVFIAHCECYIRYDGDELQTEDVLDVRVVFQHVWRIKDNMKCFLLIFLMPTCDVDMLQVLLIPM